MDFPTALKALPGNPGFIAMCPTGPVIIMTSANACLDIRNGKPRPYVGKYSDYVSIEWVVVTGEQLRKMNQGGAAPAEG